MMLISAPISTRNQFGQMMWSLRPAGQAVEVGTHRGEFAANLLLNWPGCFLTCVDPWTIPIEYQRQAKFLEGSDGNRDNDFRATVRALLPFAGRYSLRRRVSAEAVALFSPASIDFVYLDGNHEPPFVRQDIELWWEKISLGGILAGHDFLCPGAPEETNWGRHIQPAVLEFAAKKGVDVYLIPEENNGVWSYYLVKK